MKATAICYYLKCAPDYHIKQFDENEFVVYKGSTEVTFHRKLQSAINHAKMYQRLTDKAERMKLHGT